MEFNLHDMDSSCREMRLYWITLTMQDPQGNIWATTPSNGLWKWNGSSWQNWAHSRRNIDHHRAWAKTVMALSMSRRGTAAFTK